MTITYFQRHPAVCQFSIERVFDAVRAALPQEFEPSVAVCRYNTGAWRRAYNAIEAVRRQGDINHITGDIHYLAYFLKKGRTVLTVHDCGTLQRLRGWRRVLFRWLWLSLPVRRSTVVTAISEQTRKELIRYTGCAEDKIQVIPDPVGEGFQRSVKAFDAASPVILQVGAGANKNVAGVAAALKGIRCRLHIIGSLRHEDLRCLQEAAVEYWSSENLTDAAVLEAYREADVVVFASTYEGFGLPIIEANAIGRAVVTSALAPMSEVAADAACLVNPHDPLSIRAGILRVIQDATYRDSLIERGFRNVERFRPYRIAEQYAEIYRTLLKATTSPRHAARTARVVQHQSSIARVLQK